jgi:hypothetical protein
MTMAAWQQNRPAPKPPKLLTAERQWGGSLAVRQKAEVADAHKGTWQQVERSLIRFRHACSSFKSSRLEPIRFDFAGLPGSDKGSGKNGGSGHLSVFCA